MELMPGCGFVIFISNLVQKTPIWMQKMSTNVLRPVFWDYHVIFCLKESSTESAESLEGNNTSSNLVIFDFDTTLPFPISLHTYIRNSIKPHLVLSQDIEQRFHVITEADFIAYFSSDRSHMINSKVEFPFWPVIKGTKSGLDMNLSSYTDMSTLGSSEYFGTVYDRKDFLTWCDYLSSTKKDD